MTKLLRVTNPYTCKVVAEVPCDDATSVERKLAQAVKAQHTWRELSVAERVSQVEHGLAHFRVHAEEIARELSLQMGKPLVQARDEVATMLGRAEAMIALAPDALAAHTPPPIDGFVRRIEHVPLGVIFELAAWNYPLLLPVNVVLPALLAGNAVLLKHSALTPLSAQHFAKAFGELTPPGLVADLVIDHDACARLIGDARIAHVSFTGSVGGGHAVQRAASSRFIDVGLELGGKDPAYVAADADLDFAVANLVDGACYNAGQSCCGIERVYVHENNYDNFLERAREALAAYVLGDPLLDTTALGPMAQVSALDNLAQQVGDAVTRGARLLHGG
ncbi:MAG: acyl-CoA reductase-like NAD-dependent aldehyde dehydrogenase, partial [Planctomycetota bacterium]